MTPTDLPFVLSFGIVIMWTGHWLREWEGRGRERQFQSATVGWLAEISASVYADVRRIEVMGCEIGETMHDLINAPKYTDPGFWNSSGFCTNEYLINEIVNRAFIDALWPKIRNEVINPLEQLEKDLERSNQPIVDGVLNRFKVKPVNPETDPTD